MKQNNQDVLHHTLKQNNGGQRAEQQHELAAKLASEGLSGRLAEAAINHPV